MAQATMAASQADVLASLYAPIAAELAEVERRLRAELRSHDPFVDELVQYGCLLGGKRLRPALLLLTAQALGGRVTADQITLATVVEMIHTATLVHDDVLDDARMRRHLATVNARWDNEASVLLGDFLFTHAFYLASTLDSVLACRLIGRATNLVCEGELRQKGTRGRFDLSEAEYLEIIAAKTAALTAVSCELGALTSGADETLVREMEAFGRELGIAFQIADDLLDLVGDEEATGKSLGTDVEQQKMTLPLIHLMATAPAPVAARVRQILSGPGCSKREALRPYLTEYGSIDYAYRRAEDLAARARAELTCLPPSPCRTVLELAADGVVHRQN